MFLFFSQRYYITYTFPHFLKINFYFGKMLNLQKLIGIDYNNLILLLYICQKQEKQH